MRGCIDDKRSFALAVVVGLIGLAGPSPAGAATQIGETFTPTVGCAANTTWLQSGPPGGPYSAPFGGVITSWSHQTHGTPAQLKFKVAHPDGGNDFTIVGESELQSPVANALNTYPIRISVRAGDVIGFYTATVGGCERAIGGFDYHSASGDPPPGTTATFPGPFSGDQFDVSATLEADADNDGFGDETQDCAPQDPAKAEDCAAPDTTITSGPKAKTKKKRATFAFTSSEPGSTFECSLNGAPFASCSSPLTVKGKKGKNSFAVQAKDAAGNVDPTTATFDWKVKKKKKK